VLQQECLRHSGTQVVTRQAQTFHKLVPRPWMNELRPLLDRRFDCDEVLKTRKQVRL